MWRFSFPLLDVHQVKKTPISIKLNKKGSVWVCDCKIGHLSIWSQGLKRCGHTLALMLSHPFLRSLLCVSSNFRQAFPRRWQRRLLASRLTSSSPCYRRCGGHLLFSSIRSPGEGFKWLTSGHMSISEPITATLWLARSCAHPWSQGSEICNPGSTLTVRGAVPTKRCWADRTVPPLHLSSWLDHNLFQCKDKSGFTLYSQLSTQYMAQRRCLLHICWMNEWMRLTRILKRKYPQGIQEALWCS